MFCCLLRRGSRDPKRYFASWKRHPTCSILTKKPMGLGGQVAPLAKWPPYRIKHGRARQGGLRRGERPCQQTSRQTMAPQQGLELGRCFGPMGPKTSIQPTAPAGRILTEKTSSHGNYYHDWPECTIPSFSLRIRHSRRQGRKRSCISLDHRLLGGTSFLCR